MTRSIRKALSLRFGYRQHSALTHGQCCVLLYILARRPKWKLNAETPALRPARRRWPAPPSFLIRLADTASQNGIAKYLGTRLGIHIKE